MQAISLILCVPVSILVGRLLRPVVAEYVPAQLASRDVVLLPGAIALLAIAAAVRFGKTADFWVVFVLLALLVVLASIDLRVYRLPDRVVFPGLLALGALMLVLALVRGDGTSLLRAVACASIYAGVLLVPHLVSPEGLGFGDVKLGLPMGAVIGWVTPSFGDAVFEVFIAIMVGSLAGVLGGGLLVLLRKRGYNLLPDPEGSDDEPGAYFPFGPALAIGAIIVLLAAG